MVITQQILGAQADSEPSLSVLSTSVGGQETNTLNALVNKSKRTHVCHLESMPWVTQTNKLVVLESSHF